MTTWTDWRGNDYTEGDTILYARMSGRSCEMAEGVVVELREFYYSDDYKWEKLEPGEPVPVHNVWRWRHRETGEIQQYAPMDLDEKEAHWENVEVSVPYERRRRAKILPTNRTSRFGGYWNKKWVWDAQSGKGEYVKTEMKPVTLHITESITAIVP